MPVIRKRTMPYLSAAFQGKNIPRNPNVSAISEVDKSLVRELMEDDIDVELVKKEIEQLADAHDFLPLTWNEHLLHFLHSLPMEIFIIVLIVIDLCVVLSTMILEVYVDEESLVESQKMSEEFVKYLELLGSTNSCYPIHSSVLASLGDVDKAHAAVSSILAGASSNSTSHARRKRSSSTSSSSTTISGLSLPIDEPVGKTLEEVIHALHYLSIAILSLLVLEALVKIAAHGTHIFKNKMEIMDVIVNIASLVIDIMLTDMSTVGAIGKVLVILTLIWRVFRILNAIVITSRARYKFRIRMLKKTKQMLDAKVELLEKNLTRAKHEISRLSQVATFYGAPQYEVRVFAEFVEEDKTARYGIQESLMQLLRVNDAIVGLPFNRRTKEAEPKEAVTRQRRSSSLPDVSTFNSRRNSTAASGSKPARSLSAAYEDAECGTKAAAHLAAANGVGCRRRSGGGGSPRDRNDSESSCDAPWPPTPLHRRKSWPAAASAAASDRQAATPQRFAHGRLPAKNGGGHSAVGANRRSPDRHDSAGLGSCPAAEAAAAEALASEAAPERVLVVAVEPELLPTRWSAAGADTGRADFDAAARQTAFSSGRGRRDGSPANESVDAAAVAAAAEFVSSQANNNSVVPLAMLTAFAQPRCATPSTASRTNADKSHPSSHVEHSRDSGKPSLDGGSHAIDECSTDEAPSDGDAVAAVVTVAVAGAAEVEEEPQPRRTSGSDGEWSSL